MAEKLAEIEDRAKDKIISGTWKHMNEEFQCDGRSRPTVPNRNPGRERAIIAAD